MLKESERTSALAKWEKAVNAGRFSRFVPASGAASRMFQSLSAFLAEPGSPHAAEARQLVENLDRFAFGGHIKNTMLEKNLDSSSLLTTIETLLTEKGLGYARLPKGLIPFHRYGQEGRTPYEEHLVEAANTVAGKDGRCRVHFTVPEDFLGEFKRLAEDAGKRLEPRFGVRYEVTFSIQHASTDTIAVDMENRPFRLADGSLLFRPGGHGALLVNLAETEGDLVYLKNIDNVLPESRSDLVILWKRLIGGMLASLEEQIDSFLVDLETSESAAPVTEALEFLRVSFGAEPPRERSAEPERRTWALDRLRRPVRVCGVVKNAGEPGGGPFWVTNTSGEISLQIVESSQVDMGDADQKTIWNSSSHFNPVDLVCSLRNSHGRPFDLSKFVDPSAVFISRKSRDGRQLKALERPGLWNGAMAFWNTMFVEVPLETFAPVKTVFDLLRPEHQP